MAEQLFGLQEVAVKAGVGSRYLLQNVSFEVAEGDRVAVIGPTGAGKTSLLRLLNRLNDPTQGTIFFAGQPIAQFPVMQLRQQVVLVPQEPKLLGMTVKQTLLYPLLLRGIPLEKAKQQLKSWLDRLLIPHDWLDRTEVMLSQGQRQWVGLARALMLQPRALLLDEPTSALDVKRQSDFLRLLSDLTATQPLTILMSNHQLDIAQRFCNQVLYLQAGKLVYNLPATEIDWVALKQTILSTEAQDAQDWLEA